MQKKPGRPLRIPHGEWGNEERRLLSEMRQGAGHEAHRRRAQQPRPQGGGPGRHLRTGQRAFGRRAHERGPGQQQHRRDRHGQHPAPPLREPVPPRFAEERALKSGTGRLHRSQSAAPSRRKEPGEEVSQRLLHRPDRQGQGRAAGRAHRPGDGAAADHADIEQAAEEQPLFDRRARRGQDRHRGGAGTADRRYGSSI